MTKRDGWSETDITTMANEENDAFDRKAGKLLDDGEDKFLNTIAKAISAFANSGGGSIILGALDKGGFDGLPPKRGRATVRDWIEMKVPTLTDFPLADFRVHTVTRGDVSLIPADREVIVIDIGDSAAAPHQSKRDMIYYRREGGRSVPAPHFYNELLRQRLANPALKIAFRSIGLYNAYEVQDSEAIFFIFDVSFDISNVGRVSANRWQMNIHQYSWQGSVKKGNVMTSNFPAPKVSRPLTTGIPFGDKAILPGCNYIECRQLGVQLVPDLRTQEGIGREIDSFLSQLKFYCRVATETSPGEELIITTNSTYAIQEILSAAKVRCPDLFP